MTNAIPITPLEPWIANDIGLPPGSLLPGLKDAAALQRWQLERLRETIAYARERSPFYRRRFADLPSAPVSSLDDFARLPFTDAADIRDDPNAFLCVSQDRIARIVTLRTSGTTQSPKRIFFTEADLERTVAFYHHGMSTLVKPGWKVFILMPGERPGSVGDLLIKGLARMDVTGIVHGPVRDPGAAIDAIHGHEADAIVGIPVQVLSLARHAKGKAVDRGRIKSVLLSADHIPARLVADIRRIWNCDVFQHYGMTEMGLGGGVECRAFGGYHLREADLLFEIIDPDSGAPVADGEWGEVVFSTLTRRGMPLIRYRTGDRSRFLTDPCPCGSALRRMDYVTGRFGEGVHLPGGAVLSITRLDDAVFSAPEVLDYDAVLERGEGLARLALSLRIDGADCGEVAERVRATVLAVPEVAAAMEHGMAAPKIEQGRTAEPSTGMSKRRIVVL